MTLTPHMPAPAAAAQVLERCRTMFEPSYRATVAALPADLARVGGYHIGWWNHDGVPLDSGGKAIRPALVVTSAAAVTHGPLTAAATRRAVIAAVAVEMVHDFSLLHDDVMDGDRTRRHRTAAWARFGMPAAILTGDLFLTVATDLLLTEDARGAQILTRALSALCEGQTRDLAFEMRQSVSVEECLQMVEGKTAALLGAACELGAWAAGADEQRRTWMREYGRRLGIAFQLIDDLLGIWGDPQATGKPVGADLVRRKKTLPIVAAMTSGTVAGNELATRYADPAPLTAAEAGHLANLVEHAGGRRWTQQAAYRHCAHARRLLDRIDPNPDAAADLQALADLITRRQH